MRTDKGEITRILAAATEGDGKALNQLMPLVYEELRAIAGGYMSRERRGDTLQPTALVNEAYLRLVSQDHANCVLVQRELESFRLKAVNRVVVGRCEPD